VDPTGGVQNVSRRESPRGGPQYLNYLRTQLLEEFCLNSIKSQSDHARKDVLGVSFQVTFDCLNPDAVARFWAEVLHYKLQDPPPGFSTWEDFLKEQKVPEEEWDSASAIVDPNGVGSRIYFQKVVNPKTAKNRVHLDVNVGGGKKVPENERKEGIQREAERLIKLGAKKLNVLEEYGDFCIVMADPEDNEFCLQ